MNCYSTPIFYPNFQTFKSFFPSKSTFLQSVIISPIKLPILRCNVWFQKFLHQNGELWMQSLLQTKPRFWTSDPTGPFQWSPTYVSIISWQKQNRYLTSMTTVCSRSIIETFQLPWDLKALRIMDTLFYIGQIKKTSLSQKTVRIRFKSRF